MGYKHNNVADPVEERIAFPMQIPIGTRDSDGHHKMVDVDAWPTCSKYLVVHLTAGADPEWPDWTITHIPTKRCVIRSLPRKETACMVAGALSRILTWSEDNITAIVTESRDLPVEVQKWFRDWRIARGT